MISAILNSIGVWITIGVLGYTILEVIGVMKKRKEPKKRVYCEECCWFKDDKIKLGAIFRYRCTNQEFRIKIKSNKYISTSCEEEIYDGFCTELNGNGECKGYKRI